MVAGVLGLGGGRAGELEYRIENTGEKRRERERKKRVQESSPRPLKLWVTEVGEKRCERNKGTKATKGRMK